MKFANENLISQLFSIVDNFDMAFSSIKETEENKSIIEGIKLVQKEFHRILKDNGVEIIETEGKMFDPNIHEAVIAVENTEVVDGMIIEQMRTGYLLNGRLLRPAQVKIAKNETSNINTDNDLDESIENPNSIEN